MVPAFVVGWAEVVQRGVAALGVVDTFDVPEQPHPGGLTGREPLTPQEFLFQTGEEGLGDGSRPYAQRDAGACLQVVPSGGVEPVNR